MMQVLDPLTKTPGVRLAVLVAPDGVPVCVRGKSAQNDSNDPELAGEDAESLAALATSWLTDLARSVAPLSWNPPQHVVLRAARGTLVMLAVPNAVLLAICDRGASAEELRLPMEAAVARMQRILRGMGANETRTDGSPTPDAPLPSRAPAKGSDLVRVDSTGSQQSPLASGQE
jgi:predicted regulator of Ras-like GTPase activity (Roadblock/LC7/MglB family)